MKVFSGCDVKNLDAIKTNAQKLGLDAIDFDEYYHLIKLGAKNESPRGYPNQFLVIKGYASLVGNDEFVWILVEGIRDWFKTSPILNCKKVEDGFEFETENSFYKLKFIKDN